MDRYLALGLLGWHEPQEKSRLRGGLEPKQLVPSARPSNGNKHYRHYRVEEDPISAVPGSISNALASTLKGRGIARKLLASGRQSCKIILLAQRKSNFLAAQVSVSVSIQGEYGFVKSALSQQI